MKYILYLKETGEIIGHGESADTNISLLEDDVRGCLAVQEPVDEKTKRVVSGQIVDISQEIIDARKARQKEDAQLALRFARNTLLSESDWTQLADVSVANKELWDNYRQELRDLPELYSDITSVDEVTWPKPPGN